MSPTDTTDLAVSYRSRARWTASVIRLVHSNPCPGMNATSSSDSSPTPRQPSLLLECASRNCGQVPPRLQIEFDGTVDRLALGNEPRQDSASSETRHNDTSRDTTGDDTWRIQSWRHRIIISSSSPRASFALAMPGTHRERAYWTVRTNGLVGLIRMSHSQASA